MSRIVIDRAGGQAGRILNRRAFVACALAISIVCCCRNKAPTTPADHWTPGCPFATQTQPLDSLDPLLKIIVPNGGETFHVGEQCTVRVTSRFSGSTQINVVMGRYSFSPPPFDVSAAYLPGNYTVDTMVFTIPDTFVFVSFNTTTQQTDTTKIPSATDSCLMKISSYEHPQYFDYSDCYFRIEEK